MDKDKLVERCERHGINLVELGFAGFDNMRLGKTAVRDCLREAADAFACAAALRSHALRND